MIAAGVFLVPARVRADGVPASSDRATGERTQAPPPAPKGYDSQGEILLAIQRGDLKLVDLTAPVPDSVEVVTDIEYGKAGDYSLRLDLYRPKKIRGTVPGLIMIHGGAWRGGKRTDYRYYCVKFAERGYVTATISYRLIGRAPFPAAVQDAKCAVRWMRKNARKYQIDADQIGVMGASAGGHLALMVGYSPDTAELEGDGGHAGVSSRVQAVINVYGPTDLTTAFARENRLVQDFIGKHYAEAAEQYRLASPLAHASKGAPPTLTLHGSIDTVVPIVQAELLDRRLAVLGVPHEFVRMEGWPHGMDLSEEVNRYCRWHMERFLDRHLPVRARVTTAPGED